MAKYRIEINRDECTGCMACNATCPENFEMKDDSSGVSKASPKKAEVDELNCSMDAAQVCPVNCIHITDIETGKKLI